MATIQRINRSQTIDLNGRRLQLYDAGEGHPHLFVHGIFVNHLLWQRVIPALVPHVRCIAPDLPLGAHRHAVGGGHGPIEVADLLGALLERLDLEDVTVVGNDTGGAISQLLIDRHPARIGRLVLTNCDAFEIFFPPLFNWFAGAARRAPGVIHALCALLKYRPMQRLFVAVASRLRPDPALLDACFGPLRDPAIQRDIIDFLARVRPELTLDAASRFDRFGKPVDLLWSADDFLFRPQLARRLQAAFPSATLEFIRGSRAFVPLDRSDALSALLLRRSGVAA